ncbi:MAG: ferrous iron transport protein A [Verrucomicrobia bacterium]|nr:ferrous iron transport protein A [Verrucomicrobiota bacterium]
MKASASKQERPLVDLCAAGVGTKLRVRDLKSHPAVCRRLREMGFCEFAEIHKVADTGALICQVCGARVALSRSLGKQILVEPVAGAAPKSPS